MAKRMMPTDFGRALTEDEVDRRVQAWHDGRLNLHHSLHEALGWSSDEYKRWVETSELPREAPDA